MRTQAEIKVDLDKLGRDIDRLQDDVLRAMAPVPRRAQERKIAQSRAMRRVRVK